jgi:hypothetical protein
MFLREVNIGNIWKQSAGCRVPVAECRVPSYKYRIENKKTSAIGGAYTQGICLLRVFQEGQVFNLHQFPNLKSHGNFK